MKRVILIALTMFAFIGTSNAQDTMDGSSVEKSGVDVYVAAGLSMSNTYDTTFAYASYPSIELGIMKNNWSLGLVAGRGNNVYSVKDDISNYWWEVKTALSFPVGKFSGYGLLGIGNYMSTKRMFIEYGAGFSYMPTDHIGIFSQVSNWDGTWYITPGLSYTF